MSWLDIEDPKEAKRARAEKNEDAYIAKVDGIITRNLKDLATKAFGRNNFVIEREKDRPFFEHSFHIWSAKKLKGFPSGSKYSVCVAFDDDGHPLRFGCRRDGPKYFYTSEGSWLAKLIGPDPEREILASDFNQESLRRMLLWHYKAGT